MNAYDASEQAYKRGYEQGKKDARKKGRWEERYIHNGKYVAWDGFYCSVCGKKAAKSNFCANCGADMRGEGDG